MSDVYDELTDSFGSVPDVTDNLIHIARIKAQATSKNITEVMGGENEIKFYFSPQLTPDIDTLIKYSNENPNTLRIYQGARPNFVWRHKLGADEREYLKKIEEFLEEIGGDA